MHRFGMMLKSYGGDLTLAQRLVESFNTYNHEGLPLTIVVPSEDLAAFQPLANDQITVIDESVLSQYLANESFGDMRLGYINQQIVKLAFWELDIYDDYFTVDSDAVFVRPFFRADFMFDDDAPYTVLVEDNELQTDPRYFQEHWQSRSVHLNRIKEVLGLADYRTLTCHGHQIMSREALRSLKSDFMAPSGYSYRDLLEIAPYEFSWYNLWLQKSRTIPIVTREPLIKVLHHDGNHLEYAMRGLTLSDVARGYIGLVVNANFARIWPDITPQESSSVTLSRYVPASVLASALFRKTRLIPRIWHRKDSSQDEAF